ncbi:MAG: SurA N-terminal domain-containing protein [Bacteroidetes bacterium]|uniref:Periplasmic chaperone PpiD n=1 Tax=Candidatus Cryptobacteroides faecigallinarum TaxID=2840763 RepID=A0A9D9INQ2_9BACT|nr:SurA N-terminal domain-containing protein [Candidatus Cryptobacteroides faecigallinarum]
MALLEKIRVRLGVVISVVIALALLSFIIDPGTLQSVSASMSSKYDVGEINGKSVSYTDFQKEVEQFTAINEMLTGNSVHSEQQQEMIRNAVWQSMIDQYLFYGNAKAAGLNVGKAELLDLTTGDMVSPMISQIFRDETGNFSVENLRQFVLNAGNDPTGNMKSLWDYLQNSVYTQQLYTKYMSLFTQSNVTNPLMLTRSIEENNNTTDVEFVMVPFGYAQDSTITVSDSEIKKYYKEHKHLYEQPASRDIEYVVYEVEPSEADIEEATSQADELHNEFINTDNVKNFLLRNSDRQYSEYWYRSGELNTVSRDINDFVFGAGNSTGVSPLYRKDNTFYAAKVMDSKMVPDSVYVRHILLQGDDEALADSLMTVLKSGKNSFSNVAALYSADQNMNVPERGDIGWMTQTFMIPGMESVLTAKKGTLYTIDTQYGKHIVEVTKTTDPIRKKQVAIFEKEIIPSKATYNEFYSKANVLATKAAGKYENFKAAVQEEGLYAHPVNRMLESSSRLGTIDNTKEVTRWAFEAKKGQASNIITVNNDYFFVVAVKDVHKEGYATLQEMAGTIRSILYNQKLAEKKTQEVAEKIKDLGSMQAIADALNTTVSTSDNVTFASLTSQGLDPKFIGAVSVAEPGVINGPLTGSIGVYVYKVTAHDTGSFFTEDDARTRNEQMSQYSTQMLMPVMMKDGDVKDNRARFY